MEQPVGRWLMAGARIDEVRVLKLTLHSKLVGYLCGFQDGRNVLRFAEEFRVDANRPTFSLITHPAFPYSDRLLAEPWARHQRLHPSLSNLLPEGVLREMVAQGLKVHVDNEFHLLSYLGDDLPGALIASPMAPEDVPTPILMGQGNVRAVSFEKTATANK